MNDLPFLAYHIGMMEMSVMRGRVLDVDGMMELHGVKPLTKY